jgi:hypothetical protein
MKIPRLAVVVALTIALGACVAAPSPYYGYPAYSYGYGPGYYAPAYVAGPTIGIGIGGGGWHPGWR